MRTAVDEAIEFIDELHEVVTRKSVLSRYVITSKCARIEQLLTTELPDNYKEILRRYRVVIDELYTPVMRG